MDWCKINTDAAINHSNLTADLGMVIRNTATKRVERMIDVDLAAKFQLIIARDLGFQRCILELVSFHFY